MPTHFLSVEKDRTGGAVVATLSFNVGGDVPVHELFVTMQFLQNGATLPTIANVLTQFATTVTVKQGTKTIVSGTATDLFHIMNLAHMTGLAVHQSNATGADNHAMVITLPLPLGPIGMTNDLHPDFGLNPKNGTITVDLLVPADGNAIDTRKYSVGYASMVGKTPTRVITRVTRNITSSATGDGQYIGLPNGPKVELYDVAFFQTTALTAGTTTDATSIESLSLEINKSEYGLVDIYSPMMQSNLGNLSLLATVPQVSGTYLYFNLNRPHEVDAAIPLTADARININAGVADALRCLVGIIEPL